MRCRMCGARRKSGDGDDGNIQAASGGPAIADDLLVLELTQIGFGWDLIVAVKACFGNVL